MSQLVNRYGCGVVSDDFTARSMAKTLNSLDSSAIASFKQASNVAAADLSAEQNMNTILDLIDFALAHEPSAAPTR